MNKVDELVEWVALMLSSQYGRSSEWQKPYARVLVREMGEKFDLALIDRGRSFDYPLVEKPIFLKRGIISEQDLLDYARIMEINTRMAFIKAKVFPTIPLAEEE